VVAKIQADEISSIIKERIDNFELSVDINETGKIVSYADGVAQVYGLSNVMAGEMVEFEDATRGLVMNLEESSVGVVILGAGTELREGMSVKRLGKLLRVPVGDAVIGRVVNALGEPIDGKGPIETTETRFVEEKAPGIMNRKSVHEPLATGIKAIDALVPIGRGQRELIIGDRQTGKTTVAIDSINNQKGQTDTFSLFFYMHLNNAAPSFLRTGVRNVLEANALHLNPEGQQSNDMLRDAFFSLTLYCKQSSGQMSPLGKGKGFLLFGQGKSFDSSEGKRNH